MRVFIAIDIDDNSKAAIRDLQLQLQNKAHLSKGDVKWVRPENMHLTLKFLGEVGHCDIGRVCSVVEDIATRYTSFELDLQTVGFFGNKAPKIIWVGTGNGSNHLCLIQKELEKYLTQAGWAQEHREFTGHLTLCRIRNPRAGLTLAAETQNYKDLKLGTIPIGSIAVYESQLQPAGPLYVRLANYKLKGNKTGE